MKVYAISLERVKERRRYIFKHLSELNVDYKIINAVDSLDLSQEEINIYRKSKKKEKWNSSGAVACALSHYKTYKEVLMTKEKAAFIVEDDIILPKNINEILNEIEKKIDEKEIILLYYSSFSKPCKLSNIGAKNLSVGKLIYPINDVGGAVAYIISKKAAQSMVDNIMPICDLADDWAIFFKKGYFDSLRVYYPMNMKIRTFRSTISSFKKKDLKTSIINFVDKYKIPIINHYLRYRRFSNIRKYTTNFITVNGLSHRFRKNS